MILNHTFYVIDVERIHLTTEMYWNEDYAPMCEDYILPPGFEAVCSSCFDLLIKEGSARWKSELELANRK